MKIDLKERKQKHQKNKKISAVLTIVFLILTLTSIALFIVFANYKIQLLMSVAGSVVSSILAIITIGLFVAGYLQNKYLERFYSQLDDKEEQFLEGEFVLSNKYKTLKKGLSFLIIFINKEEYYLVDESLKECLKKEESYRFILKGNYVVEINRYE